MMTDLKINKLSYLLKLHFSAMAIACMINSVAQTKPPGNITLQFHHVAGSRVLALDSTYENSFGEKFTVSKFKYYISNIEFSDTIHHANHLLKNSYFLINEANPDSKLILLNVPGGTYHKISFLLGVDSAKNMSGAQTGALDPLNDMFWTWKSGYVMAKLEGRSPASTLQRRMFEYHIGGFSGEHNVLGRVSLVLPHAVEVTKGKSSQIQLQADLNKWFDGAHALSITQHPACTSAGMLAKQFSENYLRMFTLQSTQSQ
ncbi:MAG: MbnP family protein [Agriterribacter sp.]